MDKKIPVEMLSKGMYVSALDCDWSETELALQGFQISSDEEIAEIQRYCKYVYIDLLEEKRLKENFMLAHQRLIKGKSTEKRKTSKRHNAKKMATADLDIGMFIEALEVPWLDSEFQFQGFLISNKDDIAQILDLVDYVYVDVLNSTYPFPPEEVEFFEKANSSDNVIVIENKQNYENTATIEVEIESAKTVVTEVDDVLADIEQSILTNGSIDGHRLESSATQMMDSVIRNPDALIWLIQLRKISEYSFSHAINVSTYMLSFGRHLGYDKERLKALGMAGLLLDVGIVHLPKEIVQKEAEYTKKEFKIYKQHVEKSIEILTNTENISTEVINIIKNHHERYDGSGYPRGLAKDDINLLSFVAAISDAHDAITNKNRAHENTVSSYESLRNLFNLRDIHYPAAVVEQFIECIGIFNVGSIVELNSGEVGVVIEQNHYRRLLPRVMVLLNEEKEEYEQSRTLDLATEQTNQMGEVYKISRVLPPEYAGIDTTKLFLG